MESLVWVTSIRRSLCMGIIAYGNTLNSVKEPGTKSTRYQYREILLRSAIKKYWRGTIISKLELIVANILHIFVLILFRKHFKFCFLLQHRARKQSLMGPQNKLYFILNLKIFFVFLPFKCKWALGFNVLPYPISFFMDSYLCPNAPD